jgi:hypothetical protein
MANNSQQIGTVEATSFEGEGETSTDRMFVLLTKDDKGLSVIPYAIGEKEELYPITAFGSVALGSDVCAYGAKSGYLCGKVVEVDISSTIPTANLTGLNKVDLGENGFEHEEDLGGPVYTVSKIGDRTIAKALGHISSIDYSDSQHKFFYYTPMDAVLKLLVKLSFCNYNLLTYNETNAQEYDQLLAQVEIPAKN